MRDARYVWVVLIPRREGLAELSDLNASERSELMEEAVTAGEAVGRIADALGRPLHKLNTAALGNITRQLHVHVIGRRTDDAAWPQPVWGVGKAEPWEDYDLTHIARLWAETL